MTGVVESFLPASACDHDPSTVAMPQMTSSSESSSLYFQSVFNTALEAYENKTKNKLLTHPLATQLQSRNSPAAVLSMLQELIQQFDQRHRGDERLTSWLNPTVNVLFSFSALISEGVGLVSLTIWLPVIGTLIVIY